MAIVRRFRCMASTCVRKTFAEGLEGLGEAYAQRTGRFTMALQSLILSTSSTTGTRIAHDMGLVTSPRTLLRVVDRGERTVPTPRILGVDDFALRRGRTYCTLLCDLESGQPVDILIGRTAEPLATWLKDHPGVQVIARDRATAYADAARAGAPHAVQVADRFHLVRNVSDALREVVDRQRWALPEAPELPAVVSGQPGDVSGVKLCPKQEASRRAAAERLRIRYEEVWSRFRTGELLRSIAESTGLCRGTVRKYIACLEVPKRAPRRPSPGLLTPFVSYLKARWESGCRNARFLFDEISMLGYAGSASMVRHFLHSWRSEPSLTADEQHARVSRYLWKELRWAILCPKEHLRQDQREPLQRLLGLHPDLSAAYGLVQSFRDMLREHRAEELEVWLTAARESGLAPFQRLARTLTADKEAVLAGITLPWSTGQVEGLITRMKFVKRLGYGRASLPLLWARMIGLSSNRIPTRESGELVTARGCSEAS
ncbi:MAG: ISL3 family transposase [Chloroflexi bacterium]|nr:ISL3 family transposase [Chloroflexota bacterium]